MLYWCPAKTIYDNWSKGSHSLLDRGAVRCKMAHYIGVQRYIKNPEKKMDSQGGSTEACFTRRQYLPSLSINYVAITKNITYVHDWMQTQTLQKKTDFFYSFRRILSLTYCASTIKGRFRGGPKGLRPPLLL